MLNMLDNPSVLPGIGAKTAKSLSEVGIRTVRDLLYYLPRTYDDYQAAKSLSDLRPGRITIKGRIEDVTSRFARTRHMSITEAIISDNTGSIRAIWFNQPYRQKQLEKGREYYFSGNFEFRAGRYGLTNPIVRVASKNQDNTASFQPVYSAKQKLKPEEFKRLINNLRDVFADIPDLLPETPNAPPFVKENARKEALFKAHFAENQQEIDEARNYLAYEELFELILAAKLNRIENQKLKTEKIPYDNDLMHRFLKTLPFELTKAQKAATWEIIQDLDKTKPMNRLLQGDVGAGKTVVAAAVAVQVIGKGHQVALLAPTSVLAAQHAESLEKLLRPLNINVALLTGSTKRKAELKKHLESGEIDLLVGTHAILTENTVFKDLKLCIIDEQHRFGVNQRQKLLSKSIPHLLMMTATPIPRSLQLTIFGDLDVSIISTLPRGRKPIKTEIVKGMNQKEYLYPKVREELKKGRQVYWICKTIEDSPTKETASVKKQAEKLKEIFSGSKVEFLHGRMKPAEKDEIMTKFSEHKIDILVSTTVVEVGVNVPNATLMVIMDAESYGLAQLHQLRGRVGRGEHQSYCYLVTENDQPTRRLREMEKSTDGFYLAEVDLKLRGPGEIYGSLQHGALDLRIATLSDTKLISLAQKHVSDLVKTEGAVLKYKELSETIKKYQQLTTLN